MKKITIETTKTTVTTFATIKEYVENACSILSNDSVDVDLLSVSVNQKKPSEPNYKVMKAWINFKPIYSNLTFATLFQIAYYEQIRTQLDNNLKTIKSKEDKEMLSYDEKTYKETLVTLISDLDDTLAYLNTLTSEKVNRTIKVMAGVHSGTLYTVSNIDNCVIASKNYYNAIRERKPMKEQNELYTVCKSAFEKAMNEFEFENTTYSWEYKAHASGKLSKEVIDIASKIHCGFVTDKKTGKQTVKWDDKGKVLMSQIIRTFIHALETDDTHEQKVAKHNESMKKKEEAQKKTSGNN